MTEHPQQFALYLRIPGWAPGSSLALNGNPLKPDTSKGYARIRRKWANGDVLRLSILLEIIKLEANPKVLQVRGKIALQRGPLIYCLEQPDSPYDLGIIGLPVNATLTARFEPDLLGGVTTITGEGRLLEEGTWGDQLYRPLHRVRGRPIPIKAIPYCVRGNRGQKKMSVWINTVSP